MPFLPRTSGLTRFMLGTLALGSVAVIAGGAGKRMQQGYINGEQLLYACSADDQEGDTRRAMCNGFVMAIADTMNATNSVNGYRACLPEGTKVIDAKKAILKYLQDNKQELKMGGNGLAAAALEKKFPCD